MLAHADLGRYAGQFVWLEMNWHLKADLRIDNLRSDSRFQNLLSRAGISN